jgi:hypothetical protein
MSKAKVKRDFLQTLLEAGEVVLEVAEDARMNFAECSFDSDFADVDGPGADGLHVLEVRDLDELGLVFALAESGVRSVLPARPALSARHLGSGEVKDLLDLDFDLLDGKNCRNGHAAEAPAVSPVQIECVVLLEEASHDFGVDIPILAQGADQRRATSSPGQVAEVKYHLSDFCWKALERWGSR